MKTHYTYLILDKETKEFYIGVRTCEGDPKEDTYMGSMATWKRQENFNQDRHKKTILSVYATREEANEAEFELIEKFYKDPLNRNYHNNKKLCVLGKTLSDDHKLKISEANTRTLLVCPYCNFFSGASGMFWDHFNNCKKKISKTSNKNIHFNHKEALYLFIRFLKPKLSKIELAKLVGISRPTLDKYKAKHIETDIPVYLLEHLGFNCSKISDIQNFPIPTLEDILLIRLIHYVKIFQGHILAAKRNASEIKKINYDPGFVVSQKAIASALNVSNPIATKYKKILKDSGYVTITEGKKIFKNGKFFKRNVDKIKFIKSKITIPKFKKK